MKSPTINAVACACGGLLVGQSTTFLLFHSFPHGHSHPALNWFTLAVGILTAVANVAIVNKARFV